MRIRKSIVRDVISMKRGREGEGRETDRYRETERENEYVQMFQKIQILF